jgi:hypothetical protein
MNKLTLLLACLLAPAVALGDDAAPHALVVHVPPTAVAAGAPVEIEAQIDAPFAETLTVRWRALTGGSWQDVAFERSSAGGWYATLPPALSPGFEYYIRGRDSAGAETLHFASEQDPHVVRVDPSLDDRLEDVDLRRLQRRRDEVAVDVIAHDFGNRYGHDDRFIRGEITFTHHLLRTLHEVSFGFGSIGGLTPEDASPAGDNLHHGLRYGFGQVRVRVHPSVFIDGRIGLGVSHDGFAEGVRGQVTFGKPWRSCLAMGAEYLEDLGPSAWVRLQWDTAPPLLMGASVVRTDLPGAVIDRAGLYVAYDVAYRLMNRLTARAQVSYGARDGSAHFGGGLGAAVDF